MQNAESLGALYISRFYRTKKNVCTANGETSVIENCVKQELNKIEIKENSKYEVEIRATVIYVIDEIKRLLNNKVNAIELNDYIWLMSKNKELPKRPYHLTRTTNY